MEMPVRFLVLFFLTKSRRICESLACSLVDTTCLVVIGAPDEHEAETRKAKYGAFKFSVPSDLISDY